MIVVLTAHHCRIDVALRYWSGLGLRFWIPLPAGAATCGGVFRFLASKSVSRGSYASIPC